MKKSISIPVLTGLCTMILAACTNTSPTNASPIVLFGNSTDNNYLMPRGMWKDPRTGVIWDRCSAGQTWNGTTCVGKALKLERKDIVDYVRNFTRTGGHKDWRLPTTGELISIRECTTGFEKETKEVSELTAQGRVTKDVTVIKTISIPVLRIDKNDKKNHRAEREIPRRCADGSSKPTLNTNIFPNTATDARYYAIPPNNNAYYLINWDLRLDNGEIQRGSGSSKFDTGYVRAVRDIK